METGTPIGNSSGHCELPADRTSFWRSTGAGLCFAGFSLITLLATPLVVTLGLLSSPDPAVRARRTRHFASWWFRRLLGGIRVLGLVEFHIENPAALPARAAGRLIIANHPSLIDAIVLLAYLPDARCITKHRFAHYSLFALCARLSGYIDNADPLSMIDLCREARMRNEPVLIFPEGTRTRPGVPLSLHRGAAQIALRAGFEVLPIQIECNPPMLTHSRPWYRMPQGRVEYRLGVGRPVSPGELAAIEAVPPAIAARRLTQAFTDLLAFDTQIGENTGPGLPPPARERLHPSSPHQQI